MGSAGSVREDVESYAISICMAGSWAISAGDDLGGRPKPAAVFTGPAARRGRKMESLPGG
jgi:hypothetical protein